MMNDVIATPGYANRRKQAFCVSNTLVEVPHLDLHNQSRMVLGIAMHKSPD